MIKAPDGILYDVINQKHLQLSLAAGQKGTVIAFICNHCPFVNHIIQVVVNLAHYYAKEGINFIAISSSDILQFPHDNPILMKTYADENAFPFPYLYDEHQKIARAFDVHCTPDFYVLDGGWHHYYRGQFDEARPANTIAVTGADLSAALDMLIQGDVLNWKPVPSIGCIIRWKKNDVSEI
ncbi:MAG: thioredoxin family protein [Caedimonadaceae bacterium]|nr:MAG: thioredoxin family protein [Caedimonadaceae bacterium]